ncbi:MAG: SRPBCC family protein [Anaerolineae bacterium]|nr:SRPBCC family protein [Anaerolineae bacterium]
MPKVKNSIVIDAPVDKVFGYIADVTKRPEFWPSLVQVSDVERLPNGGSKLKWVYKMAGVRFEGTGEMVEYVPNQRIVDVNEGGVPSTMIWTVEAVDGGTKLTVDAEYTVKIPVLRKLAEAFLIKVNDNEMKVTLSNIKARMES